MAVLLVAAFPILLLINSAVALICLSVGSLLLYRDNRERSLTVRVPVRSTKQPRPTGGRRSRR